MDITDILSHCMLLIDVKGFFKYQIVLDITSILSPINHNLYLTYLFAATI